MVTIRFKFDLLKIKRYFGENLGAPFVIGFQVLLLACAGLLVQGNSALANELAVYAYYLLVVGVVLHLISFMRPARERANKRRVKASLVTFSKRHGKREQEDSE